MRASRVMRRFLALGVAAAAALAASPAVASANVETVECNGQTLTGSYADVIVKSRGCTLDGASVAGSVLAEGVPTTVRVTDSTVFGGVQLKESGRLVLVDSVIGGEVSVEKSRSVAIEGGTLEGGLKVIESDGNVVVAGEVPASIVVAKGVGDVEISGDGERLRVEDLLVTEQQGDVTVTLASLSDVTIKKTDGSVRLTDVATDSDTKLVLNRDVVIEQSSLGSDVAIIDNDAVTLARNDVSLEDVLIKKNTGPVVVDGNTNLNLVVVENAAVTISDNVFTDAEVSKNSGGTTIVNNTGDVLSCTDNDPAPTGSGNTITELADGQCEGLTS